MWAVGLAGIKSCHSARREDQKQDDGPGSQHHRQVVPRGVTPQPSFGESVIIDAETGIRAESSDKPPNPTPLLLNMCQLRWRHG
jgi:hypothetical protein